MVTWEKIVCFVNLQISKISGAAQNLTQVLGVGNSAGNQKITNLADGTNPQDVVNLSQLLAAKAALTAMQVGFGSASNILTGDPNYTYDNVNNVFNVGFALNNYLQIDANNDNYFIGNFSTGFLNINNEHQAITLGTANNSTGILSLYSTGFNLGTPANQYIELQDNTNTLAISTSNVTISYLSGSGTGIVGVDNTGLLSFKPGFTGTLTTASLVGKTVTITNGIITNIA